MNGAGLFASPQKRNLLLALLLVILTLALYNQTAGHPFVNFDDDRYVIQNPHVHAGLEWSTIAWAFSTTEQANWHPLTWISHSLDYQLFQLNPAGHHYVNVLLHAVNVLLLFVLLQQATGSAWRSLMVAALFAVHPINVESVAWVAERKNVLSMLFFLLAMMAYQWYVTKPAATRYATVVALFACGLMAKPQVITFPFVLLLWDYWPLQRLAPGGRNQHAAAKSFSGLLLEKIPLFLLSAASALITMKAQSSGGATRAMMEHPFSVRLANAIIAYVRYLGNALWPARLAPIYPYPVEPPKPWQVAVASLLLLSVTALVLALRRHRYLPVGWFWFLGTLVPMIGLVQVGTQAMADRYAYLPFLGLFIMLSWGLGECLGQWAERLHLSSWWLGAPAVAALLVFSALAYIQIGYWRDNVTLWSHALQVTSGNFVAEDNLGGALVESGRVEEAIPHFRTAAAINPQDPLSHLDIGVYEQLHGDLQPAIGEYESVLRLTSDRGLRESAYDGLGSVYRRLGDLEMAKTNYENALALNADGVPALIGLALTEEKSGNLDQAITLLGKAVAVQPNDVGYLLLSRALQASGRGSEAQSADQQARRLTGNFDQAQQEADRWLAP